MTEGLGAKGSPPMSTDEQRAPGQDVFAGLGELERRESLAWIGEHLPQVQRSITGQRLLYQSLGVGFVVGLAAHVGGYLLKSSATMEGLTVAAVLLGGSVVGQWVSFVRRHRAEALQAVDDTSDGQPQRKAH